MRVHEAGAELDELRIHCIIHASSETLVVRTGTLKGSLLVEVVQTDVISVVGTAATEVHIVILADTRLEHLVEPVGVCAVHEVILAVFTHAVATGQRCATVGAGLSKVVAVLVGIHQVVGAAGNLVDTEVALVVELQRLVLLTILRGDDDHTVCSTRTVDSTCRCVLQHLNGLDVVRREVADGSTHGHAVNDVQRGCATKRTNTTDAHRRVGTGLTVRGDLHTSNLTLEHRRDVRVRNLLHFLGIHNRNGTSQVGLLLSTVTHNDHLIQCHGVAFHLNSAKNGATAHGHLHVLESYIAHDEHTIGRNIQLEVSVKVCDGTAFSVLHPDRCSNEWFTVLVNNLTADLDGLLLLHCGSCRGRNHGESAHGTQTQHRRE